MLSLICMKQEIFLDIIYVFFPNCEFTKHIIIVVLSFQYVGGRISTLDKFSFDHLLAFLPL